jgi:hypothetical protein
MLGIEEYKNDRRHGIASALSKQPLSQRKGAIPLI